jgi:hypothetical protein
VLTLVKEAPILMHAISVNSSRVIVRIQRILPEGNCGRKISKHQTGLLFNRVILTMEENGLETDLIRALRVVMFQPRHDRKHGKVIFQGTKSGEEILAVRNQLKECPYFPEKGEPWGRINHTKEQYPEEAPDLLHNRVKNGSENHRFLRVPRALALTELPITKES